MSPSDSLCHVNSTTSNDLYSGLQTSCDYVLSASASCPDPWDNTCSMQQQQLAAAAAAGLFRKSPGFTHLTPATQQQQQAHSFNPHMTQLQDMESAAIQNQHQHQPNRIGLHPSHSSHLNLQQLQMSQHRHSLPDLEAQLSQMEAMHGPGLSPRSSDSAHPSDAAAQRMNRQALLNQQAAFFQAGRPMAQARPMPRATKLGTTHTYNPITGVRTIGGGAAGAGGNPRTLGTSVGSNGMYARQAPAAAGSASGLHPGPGPRGPGPASVGQQMQANQVASLQALVQQQQQQLGAYKALSAFHGAEPGAAAASMSPDEQAAMMQSLLFLQRPAGMHSGNPPAYDPSNVVQQMGKASAAEMGMRGIPFGFKNASYNGAAASNDVHKPAYAGPLGLAMRSGGAQHPDARGAEPGDGEEDLGALLHCIGTELARHNISIASATQAGWLGSVSPAAHVALHKAHAEEAAKMRRSSSSLSVLGAGWPSGPNSVCLSSSAPNSASLSSTIDELNSCMEDYDPFHQGGLSSLSPGASAGIASVEEPVHQQITQLLAEAGEWRLDPSNFLASVGFNGQQQAMMGAAAGGSASSLRAAAGGQDYYHQGLERTRSGPPLSAQFANLSLGIGFS